MELISGHVYAGKVKRRVILGFTDYIADRQLIHVGSGTVQYDGPTVKQGSRYPTISKEKFLKWAASDVTDEMPEGDWRAWAD